MGILVAPVGDRAVWLAARTQGVGASEIPVLFGLSRKTPFELWKEKTGEAVKHKATIPMRLGTLLEPLLKELWQEEKSIRFSDDSPGLYVHDTLPVIMATPDAIVNGHELWEGKCTNRRKILGEEGTDQIPSEWILQAQQQMLVMGADVCHFAVLHHFTKLKCYTVRRNPELQQMIAERVLLFWEHVETNSPPPHDWESPRILDVVKEEYNVVAPTRTVLSGAYAELALEYRRLTQLITASEKEKSIIQAKLLHGMEYHQIADIPSVDLVLTRYEVKPTEIKAHTRAGYIGMRCAPPKKEK